MGLSNIFDPIVRAYFGGNGGSSGGNAVDDGYFFFWNLDIDGRDFIDLTAIVGTNYYKISNVVLSAKQLIGSYLVTENEYLMGPAPYEFVLSESGWAGLFEEGGVPYLISGIAGTYNFNGINVTIPTNGTYLVYIESSVDTTPMLGVCKPASV